MDANQRKIFTLPEPLQDYVFDPEVLGRARAVCREFKVEEQFDGVMDFVEAVVCGDKKVIDLQKFASDDLKMVGDDVNKFSIEIAGKILAPLSVLTDSANEAIKNWGSDSAKFSNIPRTEIPKETPEDFVKKILVELDVTFEDKILSSRLEFIVVSFLKGLRSLEETKAALMRSSKVGGLEFAETAANDLLKQIQEKVVGVKFEVPVVGVRTMDEVRRPVTVERAGEALKAREAGKALEAAVVLSPPVPIQNPISPLIKEIKVQTTAPTAPHHNPLPRGEGDSSGSEKPIQNPIIPQIPVQTTKKVEEAVVPPPVIPSQRGISPRDSSDEQEIIQAATNLKEKILPLAKPITSADEAVKKIIEEVGLSLDETKQKKFLSAVDSRLRGVRDGFATRDLLERAVEQGGVGLVGGELVRVMQVLEKIVDDWQGAARTEIEKGKAAIRENKAVEAAKKIEVLKAEELARRAARPKVLPRPVVPAVSPATTLNSSGRPTMSDVISPPRKLSGPIDELQNLTIEEFRRLSSDPKEAVIKIKDKIDLLEEQGLGQKILGIKAWRSSPVSRIYLEMNKTALLAGKSIEEIAAEKKPNSQVTLTTTEIKAINEINGSLRF